MPDDGAQAPGDRLLEWAQFLFWSVVILWVLLPPGLGWPLQTVSAGYQVLGAVFALLGVAVIADWLHRAAAIVEARAITARHGLGRWWQRCGEQLRALAARVLRRPRPAMLSGVSVGTGSATGVLTTAHKTPAPRPDPATTSDREWLVRLDADVAGLIARMEQADQARGEQEREFRLGLAAQASELRTQIFRASRTGWPLIVLGLVCSGFGAGLGALA